MNEVFFMSQKNLKNQFAVITGASTGIGLELAKLFADDGFRILIVAEDAGIFEAGELLRSRGADVEVLQVDLATVDGNQKLCDKIKDIGERVDALVINAGVGVYGDFVRERNINEHLNLVNLNAISPIILTKKIVKDMVDNDSGKVLYTSSIASLMPGTYMATYNASKAFLESFVNAIREELKDTNVTITTLLPGATETNFFARAGMLYTELGRSDKDDPADVARDGYKALMKGENHVVAGSLSNKFQEIVSKVLPDTVKAKLHAKKLAPKDWVQRH
jgi:short-subunit dehydrogenase